MKQKHKDWRKLWIKDTCGQARFALKAIDGLPEDQRKLVGCEALLRAVEYADRAIDAQVSEFNAELAASPVTLAWKRYGEEEQTRRVLVVHRTKTTVVIVERYGDGGTTYNGPSPSGVIARKGGGWMDPAYRLVGLEETE